MSEHLKNEIIVLSQQAESLRISTNDEFEIVSEYIKRNKLAQKRVSELLDPNINNLYKAHKAATAQKKELLKPLIDSHEKASKIASEYLYKKEQEYLETIRKKEIEERAKAEAEAAIWDSLGLKAEAKIAKNDIPILKIEKDIPKTGVSLRKDFDFEIVNEKEINHKYLQPNMVAIRQTVRTLGFSAIEIVGGIKVYEKIATRTRME